MNTDALNPSAYSTLTIDEVATRYRTSKDTVYRWLRGGKDFPRPIELPSRGLRWTPEQLAAWDRREIERANAHTA